MINRLLKTPLAKSKKSILLLGPRQVGKSTLIKSFNPDLAINLASEQSLFAFSSNPGELEEQIKRHEPKTIFLDEIQKFPTLLNTVQVLIDDNKSLRFFITGSSARKLRRGKANLLPGRVIAFDLGPLVSAELSYEMDLETALAYGCLPEPYLVGSAQDKNNLLSTYAAVYLKEEIMAEALTRNLQGFARFLSVAAGCAGQLLDFSKISARAKVPRQSAIRYFEILEDTLIANRVEAYSIEGNSDLVKHPRYYFFDNGVLNALLKDFSTSDERKGRLFEQHIFNQLFYSAKARNEPIEISHFRTRWGHEIDFIVKYQEKVYAIEVKHTPIVSERDTKNLENIESYFGKKINKLVFYSGVTEKKIGSVVVLPWQKALKEIGL